MCVFMGEEHARYSRVSTRGRLQHMSPTSWSGQILSSLLLHCGHRPPKPLSSIRSVVELCPPRLQPPESVFHYEACLRVVVVEEALDSCHRVVIRREQPRTVREGGISEDEAVTANSGALRLG